MQYQSSFKFDRTLVITDVFLSLVCRMGSWVWEEDLSLPWFIHNETLEKMTVRNHKQLDFSKMHIISSLHGPCFVAFLSRNQFKLKERFLTITKISILVCLNYREDIQKPWLSREIIPFYNTVAAEPCKSYQFFLAALECFRFIWARKVLVCVCSVFSFIFFCLCSWY